MAKRAFALLVMLSCVRASFPYGDAEIYEVVQCLSDYVCLAGAQIDEAIREGDGCVSNIDDIVMTPAKLWNSQTLPGWSASNNQEAVTLFLRGLATTNRIGVTVRQKSVASTLLRFLGMNNDVNVLPEVKALLQSQETPCRNDAWWAYLQLAEPSVETTSFMGGAFSASLVDDSRIAAEIHKTYAKKLMALDFDANRMVITNAASMLYKTSTYFTTSEVVDRLLMRSFPTYETSSNRLAYAMLAMSPPPEITFHLSAAYFSPITNRLMSIQGPLPEVEELRR